MQKRTVETLSFMECEKLLTELRHPSTSIRTTEQNLRNHACATLMLEAGLRIGEVVRLRIDDLVFGGKPKPTLICKAGIAEKGCNREIPLTRAAEQAIQQMIDKVWHDLDSDFMFPAFPGRLKHRPITPRQLERIISLAAKNSIGRHIRPHVLRHTFATRLMKYANMRIVQTLLGHKSITSTQVYTHPGKDDLEIAIAAMQARI